MSTPLHEVASGDPTHLLLEGTVPLDPERAFDHWVAPALLVRWWPQAAETDPRPGGAYHLAWPAIPWHLRGRYLAVERPRLLAFTWAWDHEPSERRVEVTFAPAGDGTRITIRHGPYGPAEESVRAGHREGWLHFVGRLGFI